MNILKKMSECKLNVKTVELPQNIIYSFYDLSYGYFIAFTKYDDYIDRYLYLFKIQNNNFTQIKKYKFFRWFSPIIFLELKNKTILFAGRNFVSFWKIQNDDIYNSCYITRDHEKETTAEIIDAIELENENIVIQNIFGDIYLLVKNKNTSNKKLRSDYNSDFDIELNHDSREYEYYKKMPSEKRYSRNPIIYSKKNTVFFRTFKVDFSLDKLEKINTNIIEISDKFFNRNNRFEFKEFFALVNGCEISILDKKYYEIIVKIELNNSLENLIHIDKNLYICNFYNKQGKNYNDKIFLVDFNNYDFKIINSKEYNYRFLAKYENQIFLFNSVES